MNITALSAANFAYQTADIKKGQRVLLAGDVVPLLDSFQPVAAQVTCLVGDIALVDQLRARGFRALRASLLTWTDAQWLDGELFDVAVIGLLPADIGFARSMRDAAALITTGRILAVMPFGDMGLSGEWIGGYDWRGKPAAVWMSSAAEVCS
ncbi:hypothetical protein [Methyloversatilis sp. XJ19-49]|uniref:hypothetical protein n=1 Tax=Methyloversatilis sp. XJ19-49 TaxID=2963429 RepID=UPI00211B9E90|nr:hypothetical protein [Methyloversatilis sp. XJ19-49]MCQ9378847.1 hypothetical protein [Methyloversatilis sp. XJ19-49]